MAVLVAVQVVSTLLLVGLCWLVYQLVKQQGRLLLRFDELQSRFEQRQPLPTPTMGNGSAARPAQPQGLSVGSTLKPFRLPDINGKEVTLEDFSGKRVLLTHWNPSCGFCDQIASDLAELQGGLRKANTELVLVSYGEAEANASLAKKHGLKCPILLQEQTERLEAFERLGTPVAYLLDEQHHVAKPIAIGANQVPDLAREALAPPKKGRLPGERDLGSSRLMRDGLKAGTPAPGFTLPEARGGEVSLQDYRGRKVLLVFSDPHCGPCDALTPDLVAMQQGHRGNGLEVIMVGRGQLEENRRKCDQHNIEFPVVVQDKWKLSKEYGIFATPVGFLIDEHGVIERDVARGGPEILSLAQQCVGVKRA